MLFGAMAALHHFRLWRLDVARMNIESDIPALFSPGITVGEIIEMPATDRHRTPEAREAERHHRATCGAVGSLPSPLAVDASTNGTGDAVPLPGETYLGSPFRAPDVPGARAEMTSRLIVPLAKPGQEGR